MRSLPCLLAARPNAQVVIVGGEGISYGESAPAGRTWKAICLEEIASSVDLTRVHFLPPQPYDDFVRLLQVSRVHTYLTVPFVLSWSLVEAMALGCAIVASDTEPVREAIADGVSGVLTPFLDHEALADRLAELLGARPKRLSALGEAARATALSRYDRRACLERALELLGVKPPPGSDANAPRSARG
jgi:glycosyltransferase involved in cell wall biosynthesis